MRHIKINVVQGNYAVSLRSKALRGIIMSLAVAIVFVLTNAAQAEPEVKTTPNNLVTPKVTVNPSVIKKQTTKKVLVPNESIGKPIAKTPVVQNPAVRIPAKIAPKLNPVVKAKPQPKKIPNVKVAGQKRVEQVNVEAERIDPSVVQGMQDAFDAQGVKGVDDGSINTNLGLVNHDSDDVLDQLNDLAGGNKRVPENAADMPEPTTPNKGFSNAGGGLGGAPTGPSNNPADWTAGSSGQDGEGVSTYVQSGGEDAPEAEELIVKSIISNADGSVTTYASDPDGNKYVLRDYENGSHSYTVTSPDGSRTISNNTIFSDGSSQITHKRYDSNGEIIGRPAVYRFDTDGNIIRTQDPNSDRPSERDAEWARWMAKWSGQRPNLSFPKSPDRVNPGPDGTTPNTAGPRLTPTELQLTGQPSLTDAAQQRNGKLDPETARKMFDAAKVGPGARPPRRP